MKKLLAVMMVAFTLVIIGGFDNQAEAGRVPVGWYRDNGARAYLLTPVQGNRNNFYCTVVDDRGGSVGYHFWLSNGGPRYSNDWGANTYVYGTGSPVAEAIWNYIHG